MSRLKEQYQNEIVDAMIKKFGYKNVMEVPKLDKVVINMGVGEARDNAKVLESAVADMEKIAGQKAVVTRAKNSVANFKIREGMPIGCNEIPEAFVCGVPRRGVCFLETVIAFGQTADFERSVVGSGRPSAAR